MNLLFFSLLVFDILLFSWMAVYLLDMFFWGVKDG